MAAEWVTVAVLAVVFLATLVLSAFGFGEALVAVPLLAWAPIVLAGLLSTQAPEVIAAYAAQGCAEERRLVRGDWTILRLAAPALRRAAPAAGGDRAGWATDGR